MVPGEEDKAKGTHWPVSPAVVWAQVALDEWSPHFFQRHQGPWAGEQVPGPLLPGEAASGSSLWPHLRSRPGVLGFAGLGGHLLRASALSPERGQRDGPLCGKGASPGQTRGQEQTACPAGPPLSCTVSGH